MKRFLMISFVAAALFFGTVELFTPPAQAAGGGCPKGMIRCLNCDGSPGMCARSWAFCPECPAP